MYGNLAAIGKPVMCAIIFSAKEMCTSGVLGLNASTPWVGNDSFNGKTVPTFCCCSEYGRITSELSVEMLCTTVDIGIFDQSIDGYGSRFELTFLR
jgi:hypothetical protein